MIQVAMLWLANENGELLLARRADHKKQDPGLWGPSVTGKVDPGETFEQAVVRETTEELALQPADYTPEYLFDTTFKHPDGETREFKVYIATISQQVASMLVHDTNEVAEVKWLPISDIKALLNTKPGDIIVASAFALWSEIFEALEARHST